MMSKKFSQKLQPLKYRLTYNEFDQSIKARSPSPLPEVRSHSKPHSPQMYNLSDNNLLPMTNNLLLYNCTVTVQLQLKVVESGQSETRTRMTEAATF